MKILEPLLHALHHSSGLSGRRSCDLIGLRPQYPLIWMVIPQLAHPRWARMSFGTGSNFRVNLRDMFGYDLERSVEGSRSVGFSKEIQNG